jgi:hypothetical protein
MSKHTIGLRSFEDLVPPQFIQVIKQFKPKSPSGIDLNKHADDVKRLFYSQFGAKVIKLGFDPEDVLQEIYKGILIRNEGSPFNPAKAKFSTYVVMVCRCVVSNYITKHQKTKQEVQISSDKLLVVENRMKQEESPESNLVDDARSLIPTDKLPIFNDLIAGYTKAQIQERHGIKVAKINQFIVEMKDILAPILF